MPLLLVLVKEATDRIHAQLAALGYGDVSATHGFVFQLVASQDGATGRQVAEHLGVTKQAAAQVLDHLERAGYLTRAASGADRRARIARLTPRGWDCIDTTVRLWRELENELARVTTERDVKTTLRTLSRLESELGDNHRSGIRLQPIT